MTWGGQRLFLRAAACGSRGQRHMHPALHAAAAAGLRFLLRAARLCSRLAVPESAATEGLQYLLLAAGYRGRPAMPVAAQLTRSAAQHVYSRHTCM